MKTLTSLLALVIATSAAAQGPPPGTPPGRPLEDAAVAESLKVLAQLDQQVAKSRDGALWYRRAMVAWALTYRGRLGPAYAGLDWTRIGRVADSSMRVAMEYAPNNPRVALSSGQFFLSSAQTGMRKLAEKQIEKAAKLLKGSKDTALVGEAKIEQGRVFWRQYDALANRRVEPEAGAFERHLAIVGDDFFADSAQRNMSGAQKPGFIPAGSVTRRLNETTQALPPDLMGGGDYTRAEEFFREAYALVPADARAFHQLVMLFAEKKRWAELATFARARVRRQPKDAQAWLALGVSLQRTKHFAAAAGAFDTALKALEPRERAYITSLKRVMPTQDEGRWESLSPVARDREAALYWRFMDPLWSRGGNDAYAEFLARAAYADIRWTVEELGVRGIDSDRGMVHIRYGAPATEAVLGPRPSRDDIGADLGSREEDSGINPQTGFKLAPKIDMTRPGTVEDVSALTTLWAYDSGLLVIFHGLPTYGTARIPAEDIAIVDDYIRGTPASWKGAVEEKIADMPAQLARFRATGDSVDLVVAVEPPIQAMREQTGTNAPIRADFWLFGRDRILDVHDSASVRTADARAWRYRVTSGTYAYRVETTSEGAMMAGLATEWIDASKDPATGFATSGPGISDVMLVASVTPRPGAKRWLDIDVRPTAGTVAKGGQIALVWENYELGNADGSAKYQIAVSIERRYKQKLNQIRARVVSVLAAMVGEERTDDRVTYRYERSVAHTPTVLDYLTLDLVDTPPGEYRLTIDITDRVTGTISTRTQKFIITE